MYVVLAFVSDRPLPAVALLQARERVDTAVRPLLPDTYIQRAFGGTDWGIIVHHTSDLGGWRWPVLADEDGVIAVSLGVPIGLDATIGPIGLAGCLLRNEDMHTRVVPPFGMIALGDGHQFAVQQDWLGMCRLFTGASNGVTVFGSRPALVAEFLQYTVAPDHDGWLSYAASGHFGGDTSPIRGVHLLGPGERASGRRYPAGGWDLNFEKGYCVDDVVSGGIALREQGLSSVLNTAAHGLETTLCSIDDLYDGSITIGLSGGKDSRLIAASFIASGRVPAFTTNIDTVVEGETASRLIELLRDRRGLRPDHSLVQAGPPTVLSTLGLRDRVRRLQALYDYQFPVELRCAVARRRTTAG